MPTGVKETVVTAPVAPEAVKPEPRIVRLVALSPREMPETDREVMVGLATTWKFCEVVLAETPPVKLVWVIVTGYVPTESTIFVGAVIPTVVAAGVPVVANVVPTVDVVVSPAFVENVPVPTIKPFQGLVTVGTPPASIATGAIEARVGSATTFRPLAPIRIFDGVPPPGLVT